MVEKLFFPGSESVGLRMSAYGVQFRSGMVPHRAWMN